LTRGLVPSNISNHQTYIFPNVALDNTRHPNGIPSIGLSSHYLCSLHELISACAQMLNIPIKLECSV
jgi:hypothetical protein